LWVLYAGFISLTKDPIPIVRYIEFKGAFRTRERAAPRASLNPLSVRAIRG